MNELESLFSYVLLFETFILNSVIKYLSINWSVIIRILSTDSVKST